MFPTRTPAHVQEAHRSIAHIHAFLAKYEQWVAAGGDYCDFALGNPQSMALEGFVTALRDAVTPQNALWYSYKLNERASREIIAASLKRLTGHDHAPEDIFIT